MTPRAYPLPSAYAWEHAEARAALEADARDGLAYDPRDLADTDPEPTAPRHPRDPELMSRLVELQKRSH